MKISPIVVCLVLCVVLVGVLIILPDGQTDFSKYTGAFSGLLPGNLPFGG